MGVWQNFLNAIAGESTEILFQGIVSRDFRLKVFSWIPPSPRVSHLGSVSNFFENSRRYSQLEGHHRWRRWHRWQIKKIFNQKILHFFEHLWVVESTYRLIFFFKFTLKCQQFDRVPLICRRYGINDTSGIGGKCAASVIDTGSKFATSVVDTSAAGVFDTGGAPWLSNISANFWNNSKWPWCYYQ